MDENLEKYAPLYPKSDLLGALFTGGMAGGVIYVLLNQFVQNVLK